jgi:hypothetical protein
LQGLLHRFGGLAEDPGLVADHDAGVVAQHVQRAPARGDRVDDSAFEPG